MKILLIGNYINDQQFSINRFVSLVEKGLTQIGLEVRRIQPEPVLGQLLPSVNGLGKWLGYIDKLLIFPFKLRQSMRWADLVCICDQGFSYYAPYLQDKTHLVICHDMLAIRSALGEIPENPTSWTGRQYQSMILRGLKQAQHIACSSEATRADVLRLTKVAPQRTTVVEDCLDENYEMMPREEALARISKLNISPDVPLLLHVGGAQWYKNKLVLLQIFNYLRQRPELENLGLATVGKPLNEKMRQFLDVHNLRQRVIELVALPNDDLRALYSIATALIFPSLQEGFGVPVIEAQACGCPVFTSNRLPMTEVGGEAAVYFDPKEPESAAEIIAETLLNPEQIRQMKQKGFTNAARFSFQRMIQSYEKLFTDLAVSRKTDD
jgi:glycosyltransferase involved in cell wall biosynthesis